MLKQTHYNGHESEISVANNSENEFFVMLTKKRNTKNKRATLEYVQSRN